MEGPGERIGPCTYKRLAGSDGTMCVSLVKTMKSHLALWSRPVESIGPETGSVKEAVWSPS